MNFLQGVNQVTRRLSILLLIVVLVSVALVLYYFKYVPDNRERLQKQGFLILKQHEDGLRQSLQDMTNHFSNQNKIKRNWISEQVKSKLPLPDNENVDNPFSYEIRYVIKNGSALRKDSTASSPIIRFHTNEQTKIEFEFRSDSNLIIFAIPFNHLFEKVIDPDRLDFFHSYLVVSGGRAESSSGKNKQVLYQSTRISTAGLLPTDSIGNATTQLLFSKIADVTIDGNPYKAFLLPFKLQEQQLTLTGLLPASEYHQKLQRIPFVLISSLLFIFIFILISLPYLKVFFISQGDRIGITDMTLIGLSLFAGTAILMIIFQQGIRHTGVRFRTTHELRNLGQKIDSSFREEISRAYKELKFLDSSLLRDNNDSAYNNMTVREKKGKGDYHLKGLDKNLYLNYVIMHWSDTAGQQVFKRSLLDNNYNFINLSHRQYFKDVINHHLFSFRGEEVDSFSLQPVYSITTNQFEVNLAIPSRHPKYSVKMAALSLYMYSVMNTILPRGYGFHIINNDGLILFQSDGDVTLRENFLDKLEDHGNIRGTIQNRLSRFIPDQYINDKQYHLYILPVQQLPYYLIVYRCNDYDVASVMHVSAFVLFFVIVLYLLLLLYCFIAWESIGNSTRLHQRIHQYDWIKPSEKFVGFYLSANVFLVVYISFATVFTLLFAKRDSSAWIIGLMAPLFVVWTLCRFYLLSKNGKSLQQGKITTNLPGLLHPVNVTALVLLLLITLAYFQVEQKESMRRCVIVFEVLSFIPLLFTRLKKNSRIYVSKSTSHAQPVYAANIFRLRKRIFHVKMIYCYSLFWFLAVMAVSVFPVFCFIRYAQDAEIGQQIKTDQLSLAAKTEKRLSTFGWLDKIVTGRNLQSDTTAFKLRVDSAINSLLFSKGIYGGDSVVLTDSVIKRNDTLPYQSVFYEKMTRNFNWGYRSLSTILPDEDTAFDQQWFRNDLSESNSRQMILYSSLKPENLNQGILANRSAIRIKTSRPTFMKYYHMNGLLPEGLIWLSGIFCLVFFYRLITAITKRLFPQWDISIPQARQEVDCAQTNVDDLICQTLKKNWGEVYTGISEVLKKQHLENNESYQLLRKKWEEEYHDEHVTERTAAKKEFMILFNQYHLSVLYKKLWDGCTDNEKFFLFDLSRDGFINPKDVQLVHQLLFKGLLVKSDLGTGGLKMISVSFRNFILEKNGDAEISKLKSEFHQQGTWSKVRTPVLITIAVVCIFLFITQEDLMQRIAALIPTLTALFGLGGLLLGSRSAAGNAK
ncbi:cache domain-containing protein [Lacibacter sediminis]|uniref:Cache domain-containing protein n=1 Tax=Lacibacter sediminis TaxID=2760713 RepID=A0A7G5XKC5_9BACT|nr:cache domain-containing protein [Lacibacter sediminis]QNA45928.1 cache domain-containing protein [Lacibacter sediminis]